MAFVTIPTRVALQDLNSAADINQLMENIEYVKAQTENNNSVVTNEIDIKQATYSEYYVVDSLRTSPNHGELNYLTTNNKLYKYNAITGQWIEIDWVNAVKATPEWQSSTLFIEKGVLKFKDWQGSSSYQVYPLVGSNSFVLCTLDTSNYTYKYYMQIGSTIVQSSINHLPVTLSKNSSYMMNIYHSLNLSEGYGFKLSNVSISDGILQYLAASGTSSAAQAYTNVNFLAFSVAVSGPEQYTNAFVKTTINRIYCNTINNSADGSGIQMCFSAGTFPSTGYWFGPFWRNNNNNITLNHIAVRRIA